MIYYKLILILFIIIFGISSVIALSVGGGISFNITINNSGVSNYSNTTHINPNNQTAIVSNQTTNNSTTQNNSSNASPTTNNNNSENTNSADSPKSKITLKILPSATEEKDSQGANKSDPLVNQNKQDKITGASISSKSSSDPLKFLAFIPTVILAIIFFITYYIYRNKTNKKNK